MFENGGSQQGGGLKTGDLQIAPYCKVQLSQSSSDEHTSLSKIKNNKTKNTWKTFVNRDISPTQGSLWHKCNSKAEEYFRLQAASDTSLTEEYKALGIQVGFVACGTSDGFHSWRLGSSPGFENMAGPPAWFKLHFS